MNDREMLYNALSEIVFDKKFMNYVINDYMDKKEIANKALFRKVISGVLENKIRLNYIIDKYLQVAKINEKIRLILQIGIYEILFLDSIKSYATVNEYVNLTKKIKGEYLSKFVNAVLRNIDKDKITILNENLSFDIKYSVPKELYMFLSKDLNSNDTEKDLENIFKFYLNEKYIFLRINANEKKDVIINELKDKNFDYKIYDKSLKLKYQNAIPVKNADSFKNLNCFKEGLVSVEDISSIYFIDKLYDILKSKIKNEKYKILDSCASPGGKTLAISNLLKSKDHEVIACDKTEKKLKLIAENMTREKNQNITLLKQDATKINREFLNNFDLVMVDAPCLGLGVIGKKSDIKYNFKIKNIKDIVDLQKKILNIQKDYVKKGGILTFSTCSLTKTENNIDDFLKFNKDFKLLYSEQILSNEYNLSDGFYFAIMEKIL